MWGDGQDFTVMGQMDFNSIFSDLTDAGYWTSTVGGGCLDSLGCAWGFNEVDDNMPVKQPDWWRSNYYAVRCVKD
jgi:hypothetical protein